MTDDDRGERLAAALIAMCKLRNIPTSGYALSKYLRSAGFSVHQNTLDMILKGRRWPRRTTLESILSGLNASDSEHDLIISMDSPAPRRAGIVSWLDAIKPYLDKGRDKEEVVWEYWVGLTDHEDTCVEHRRTTIGPGGLSFVSFEPGQIGISIFDLLDTARLDLRIQGTHLGDGSRRPVTMIPQPIQLEPSENRLGVAICLSEALSEGCLVWSLTYRWPGLWRSLREEGMSRGRLNFPGPNPAVTKASVVVKAPVPRFDDLELAPQFPRSGTVKRETNRSAVHIRWTVDRPVSSLGFELRSGRGS